MSFLSPLWLLGLLPWAALVAWLLWGRRPQVRVPFVALWQITAVDVHARRSVQAPPVAVALVILSLLLALLGAAGMVVHLGGTGSDVAITLLLDRGASMSARAAGSAGFRFQDVSAQVAQRLASTGDAAIHIHLIDLGDGSEHDLRVDRLTQYVDSKLPTLVDTADALRQAIVQQSRVALSPIIAITDQLIDRPDANVLCIAPATPVRDVGIQRLAVRRLPTPQVMVTILNQGLRDGSATLQVSSDDWQTSQTISLPAAGTQRDYFVDAERLGDVTRAQIKGASDDLAPDDRAVVAREGNGSRIEVRGVVGDAMQRLIQVYRAHRPTAAGSPTLVIANDAAALGDDTPGLVLALPADAPPAAITPLVRDNANLLEGVDLTSLPGTAAIASGAPPWPVVLSGGGHVLVAAREEPVRQLWVGFDAPAWASTPDFVVFFSSCLDWISAGGARDVSHPLTDLQATWKLLDPADPTLSGPQPGVYRLPDGGLRALVLAPPAFGFDDRSAWEPALDRLVRSRRPGFQLASPLLLLALLSLLGAVATWRRRSTSNALPGHAMLSESPDVRRPLQAVQEAKKL